MAALLPLGSRSSDCGIEALECFCGHLQGLKVFGVHQGTSGFGFELRELSKRHRCL